MEPAVQQDPLALVHGTLENKYLVEAFVAEGGFSFLYRARHQAWNQPVAIKFLKVVTNILPAQRDLLLKNFLQEGALLRELSSRTASILQAYDLGSWTSPTGAWYPYLVLEWLDGEALDTLLENERAAQRPAWSLPQCMRLLEPAAKALELTHRRGITHRDLKPANLFVLGDPHGPEAFIKVLDFGIAKVVQDAAQLSVAAAQTGLGFSSFTPAYGAPEQFSRATYGATGPWTDVYAMALILVEMLTFAPATEGDDVTQLAFSCTNTQKRPTPRTKGLQVSEAVEQVFSRALAVKPADRYATMGEFWNALRSATGQAPLRAETPSSSPVIADTPPHGSSLRQPTPLSGSLATAPTELIQPAKTSPLRPLALLSAFTLVAVVGGWTFLRQRAAPRLVASPSASIESDSISPGAFSAQTLPESACLSGMVRVEGGPFFMGYDGEGALPFEKPPHPVTVSSFCIDVTEVTVEAYQTCSDSGRCPRAANAVSWPSISAKEKRIYGPLCNTHQPGKDRHPINCVDWDMARTYCATRGEGVRLPTSAEWEFAVRGKDGRVYPWGDAPPDANHLNACGTECVKWGSEHGETLAAMHQQDDGFPTTAPVGSFPRGRSLFGLDDVIGNVMEWVSDWDGPYEKSEQRLVDPAGPVKGTERVIRGGAWNAGHMAWVRPSFRFRFPPETRSHAVGFRCASTATRLAFPVNVSAFDAVFTRYSS